MNWRSLLTRQSQTWSEKQKPPYRDHNGDVRKYVAAWDRLNNYVKPCYAWDNANRDTA